MAQCDCNLDVSHRRRTVLLSRRWRHWHGVSHTVSRVDEQRARTLAGTDAHMPHSLPYWQYQHNVIIIRGSAVQYPPIRVKPDVVCCLLMPIYSTAKAIRAKRGSRMNVHPCRCNVKHAAIRTTTPEKTSALLKTRRQKW